MAWPWLRSILLYPATGWTGGCQHSLELLIGLVGEADPGVNPDVDDEVWRAYTRHLSSKEDFKLMMADMKETLKSEIAVMRQDVKAIANRVDQKEEAHDDLRRYTAQLQPANT